MTRDGRTRARIQSVVHQGALALPVLVFVCHACAFGAWIVDDAGISFAYARNLAHGHGLVSQPGATPVEGYSNPLWVLVLSLLCFLRLFHPMVTPKLLGLALVVTSFVVTDRTMARSGHGRAVAVIALTCVALSTSFVLWTMSGLENSLYVLLISLLLYWSVKCTTARELTVRSGLVVGVLAAATAMTRPEGVFYAAACPLLVLGALVARRRGWIGRYGLGLAAYALAFAALLGGFLLFRLLYFGDLYPNTYYVKGSPSWETYVSAFTLQPGMVAKAHGLLAGAIAGRYGSLVLAALVAAAAYLFGARRAGTEMLVWLLFVYIALLAYVLLPEDWMPEYRFATPFFLLFYGWAAMTVSSFLKALPVRSSFRVALAALVLVVVGAGTVRMCAHLTRKLAGHPCVSLASVARRFAARYDRYADELGLEGGSVLLPDAGGTLYYCRVRVYDLGMLTDKTIAKTVRRKKPLFYDYIFDVARPTFIHVHGYWTHLAALDGDPRFRRDYVPIDEYLDDHVKERWGVDMYSGDYVRRDAVGDKLETLRLVRREFPVP